MQKIINPKNNINSSPTLRKLWRGLSITLLENILTKGLNFLIILMLSRSLGPVAYGKYSFVFVSIAFLSAFFDMGMENTAVHFAAKQPEKESSIFGAYFLSKIIILLMLTLIGVFGGDTLLAVMGKESIQHFLIFILLGLWGESLFFVNDTYLQARQQFQLRAVLNISRYSFSLLLVIGLLVVKELSLSVVMTLFLIPLIFSVFFLKRYVQFLSSVLKRGEYFNRIRQLWPYQQWMSIYAFANNLLGRLDFIMLGFWVGFEQLGIYNAAFQLCAVVSFLPYVLGKVLLPTLSSLKDNEVLEVTNQMLRYLLLIAGGGLLLIPVGGLVVPLLLGADYAQSTVIFQILLLAFLVGLLTMPYEQALYALEHPKTLSAYRYIQLSAIVLLNSLFIPSWGIYAAAFITLIGRVVYLLMVKRFYKRCCESIVNQKSFGVLSELPS